MPTQTTNEEVPGTSVTVVRHTQTKPAEETSGAQPVNAPHELRMGVAMSGAIALVLYESGVAHEILRFLEGAKRADITGSPADEEPSAYESCFREIKIRPFVDILTGASAGGINSILMASCITGDGSFDDMRNTWVKVAGVDRLRYGSAVRPRSLLDPSELINKIRGGMVANATNAAKPDKVVDDIDVRICRTDVLGDCKSTLDALQHQIDVDTKANVIRFTSKHFKNPESAQVQKLLDAAAATSAFPTLFPPVQDENVWYSDGGLWDNQPVDLAVQAVTDKPAFGITHRCILFTEPNPSRARQIGATRPAVPEPSVVDLAGKLPFLGIKGNLWPALEDILNYNRRSRVYQQLLHDVAGNANIDALGTRLWESASQCLKTASALFGATPPPFARVPDAATCSINQARVQEVLFGGDPALINRWHGILERLNVVDGRAAAATPGALAVHAAHAAMDAVGLIDLELRTRRRQLDDVNKSLDPCSAHPVEKRLTPEKLALEKAALYRRIHQITDFLSEPPNTEENKELNYREADTRSRFRQAAVDMMDGVEKAWKSQDPANTPDTRCAKALNDWVTEVKKRVGVANTRPSVSNEVTDAYKRYKGKHNDSTPDSELAKAGSLLCIKPVPDYDPPSIDVVRYVLATISDLIGKKPIDLIRVSPNDTFNLHLIGERPSDTQTDAVIKLAGEGLGHITGFLEERWRRNDYIWGRLDACEILLRTVYRYSKLTDRPMTEAEYEKWLVKAQGEILKDEAKNFDPANQGLQSSVGAFDRPADPDAVPPIPWTNKEKAIQAANCKLIGFGNETWEDANQPGFADNLHYLARTTARLLQGNADKAPNALSFMERIARLNAYLVRALTWLLARPSAPQRSVVWYGVVAICLLILIGGAYAFGWVNGHPHADQLAHNFGWGLIGAAACFLLGSMIGFRFGAAVWAALLTGLIAGINLRPRPLAETKTSIAPLTTLVHTIAPASLKNDQGAIEVVTVALACALSVVLVGLLLAVLDRIKFWTGHVWASLTKRVLRRS